MSSRLLIVGGPGCGKSTRALQEARKRGCLVLCTDTKEQAAREGREPQLDGVLYAPPGMTWSGTSEWIADSWLCRQGPFVMEGVALPRALRKWRERHPDEAPPCDEVIWLREPRMELTDGQARMLVGVETVMNELIDDWSELYDLVHSF